MLIERPVDFAHGFRMRCETCKTSNWLTEEDWQSSPDAMAPCSGCGDEYHFGPAVIDLRDPEDPTLDDQKLPELAWYHTTNDPGWPGKSKPAPERDLDSLRLQGFTEDRLRRYSHRRATQALHVGTYEAAIESMLRRMRNQGGQDSEFYLHRVRLRQDVRIEDGWRDENNAAAAAVTQADLANHGVEVIRYLNAYESIGSLSLAVVPEAIASTQSIRLPIQNHIELPDTETYEWLKEIRERIDAVRADARDRPLTPLEKLRKRASDRMGGTELIPNEVYAAARELEEAAANRYLGSSTSMVSENFLRSLRSPDPVGDYASDMRWLIKFRALATILTSPDSVHRALDAQPWHGVDISLRQR